MQKRDYDGVLTCFSQKRKKLKGGAEGEAGRVGQRGRNDSVLCAERSTREMKRRQRIKKFQVSSVLLTESPLVGFLRKILAVSDPQPYMINQRAIQLTRLPDLHRLAVRN